MKTGLMMERQIPNLSQQDCKKLFPEQYYTKYAAHLKILKFQESILNHHEKEKKNAFVQRKLSAPSLLIQINATKKKTKLNKYDVVADTVQKNKLETVRMNNFVKNLNNKLKSGAAQSLTTIRTPLTGFNQIPENVYQKMKYIEEDAYNIELIKMRQKKRKLNLYMNFKPRSRYHSISASKFSARIRQKSICAESAQSQSIQDYYNASATLQLHPIKITQQSSYQSKKEKTSSHQKNKIVSQSISYQDKLLKVVAEARSQIISFNPEDKNMDLHYIMTMNQSIRKINNLKGEMVDQRRKIVQALGSASKTVAKTMNSIAKEREENKQRKNLIKMTDSIRKEGQGIQILSRYDNLLKERQLKVFINKFQ